ncbi:VOC family protein [Streptosporangium jomthongense]|uniref:VOC family protein n=1 Tax=Streptosporangium jomthongense TaxID=1193683 RepID=A0ABV8F1B2_9ACTN
MTTFSGVHHIALNVRDLDASVRWYGDVLDFAPLFPWNNAGFERQLMRHPSGVIIGLTRHKHEDGDAEFNERRTGLDHLAFTVDTRQELDAWATRLTEAGVTHSGVQDIPEVGFALLAFRDPDGIQLEVFLSQNRSQG